MPRFLNAPRLWKKSSPETDLISPSVVAPRALPAPDERSILGKLDSLDAARTLLNLDETVTREMNPASPGHALRDLTRRHFFSRCSVGLGAMALSDLMASPSVKPHFPAKAKHVIYLFMAGGPSQLETFDYKPKLSELNGQPIPESYTKGKRFAFMDSSHRSDLLGPRIGFQQYGESGDLGE